MTGIQKPKTLCHVEEIREAILARDHMLRGIRTFFQDRHFVEVETPSLVSGLGTEPHITPFQTSYVSDQNPAAPQELYLITSPEFAMKKLLAGGLERIFQITKVFRNGESSEASPLHNPEFTMLEWYRTGATAEDIMNDLEAMVVELSEVFSRNGLKIVAQEKFSFVPPYERIRLEEAFQQFSHISLQTSETLETLQSRAQEQGFDTAGCNWEEIYWKIFVERVEPHLPKDRPFFLVDYPKALSCFAKMKADGIFADRFELYLGEVEVANGFSEITEASEQKHRFDHDNEIRSRLHKKPISYDQDYLNILTYGMPENAGVAVGLDRLLVVLLNQREIRDVLAFPFTS